MIFSLSYCYTSSKSINSAISGSSVNVSTQLLQVPGSYDRLESISGSPRRPGKHNILASVLPPDESTLVTAEELATHRRFSVTKEAMERHSTRRKAKRSQSVIYRPGQGKRGGKMRTKSIGED